MKTSALIIAISLALNTAAIAKPHDMKGHGEYGRSPLAQTQLNTCEPVLSEETALSLTAVEQQHLAYMREEEKLARDVYVFLADKWPQAPVFVNITRSEQEHMNTIKRLLDAAQLADSAHSEAGVFNNGALQTLYNDLTVQGSASLAQAYQVGALIEEVDIADLQTALTEVENTAVVAVFNQLINGSYHHLRAFVGQMDGDYTAQKLSPAQVDGILTGDVAEQGHRHGMGMTADARPVNTSACFNTEIQSESGAQGNNIQVSSGETVNIGSTITPANEDVGLDADLVTTVEFTPNGSNRSHHFMRVEGQWQAWDGNMHSLKADRAKVKLNRQENVPVYQGALPAGEYAVSVGYRLQNGSLFFNAEDISLSAE